MSFLRMQETPNYQKLLTKLIIQEIPELRFAASGMT